jgi:putative membrane protein insertion efficiency factor
MKGREITKQTKNDETNEKRVWEQTALIPFGFSRVSSFFVTFVVSLLRLYQYLISPILPPSCRFTPTCSEYAIEAVKKHGVWKGALLAVKRLARCHPFCAGGYDPVR